jgi:hypothetical protein
MWPNLDRGLPLSAVAAHLVALYCSIWLNVLQVLQSLPQPLSCWPVHTMRSRKRFASRWGTARLFVAVRAVRPGDQDAQMKVSLCISALGLKFVFRAASRVTNVVMLTT